MPRDGFCKTCGLFSPCPTCSPPRIGLAPISPQQADEQLRELLTRVASRAFQSGLDAADVVTSSTTVWHKLVADEINKIVNDAVTKVPR